MYERALQVYEKSAVPGNTSMLHDVLHLRAFTETKVGW